MSGTADQLYRYKLLAGLGEAREAALLQRLRSEAKGLAGELVLGHLCEAAQVPHVRLWKVGTVEQSRRRRGGPVFTKSFSRNRQ